MKKKRIRTKAMGALLGAMALVATTGIPAHAVTYTVDTLIGQIDSAQSGQAYEEQQLELACSCNVTLQTNVNSFTVNTDDAGNNYLDVTPNTPGYFLLKFGNGNGTNDMFFFQNIGELNKLVWTNAQLGAVGLTEKHYDSLSHYAITSSGNVPEPTSLLLLGAGVAGVSLMRRKVA